MKWVFENYKGMIFTIEGCDMNDSKTQEMKIEFEWNIYRRIVQFIINIIKTHTHGKPNGIKQFSYIIPRTVSCLIILR